VEAATVTHWLIIFIYGDSFLFVLFTGVLSHGLGVNTSPQICEGAILLCLICYVSTKVMIYYFLVEKAHVVRATRGSRMQDKQYLVNIFAMICPYLVVVVLNFVFRFSYIDSNGQCIIGMEKKAMIPLIGFDVLVNVYLTMLFLIPLRRMYSYKHNTNAALRTTALRTFIGSCMTLLSSVVNLTVLMVLKGEPGWICLMCCNADILFSVLVLHWVTSIDKTSRAHSEVSNSRGPTTGSGGGPRGWQYQQRINSDTRPTVTTCVSGIQAGQDLNNNADMPLNEIQVTIEQTQEVQVDTKSESSQSVDRKL